MPEKDKSLNPPHMTEKTIKYLKYIFSRHF